jgi:hypothetical protein
MRFRKIVSIGKIARVNFSKSGASLTLGVPGVSVNIGKSGAYLNTGIPGTGLYNRQKISGSSRSSGSRQSVLRFSLDVNETNEIVLLDEKDKQIIDESVIRRIKRTEEYKHFVLTHEKEMKEAVDNANTSFVNLYKLSPELINKIDIEEKLNGLELKKYDVQKLKITEPNKHDVKIELFIRARKEIKSFAFWSINKKREEFVNDNLENEFKNRMNEWKDKKERFLNEQNEIKEIKDKEFKEEYIEEKYTYESIISGDPEYVESEIDDLLSRIQLPVEFSIQYEYENNNVFIDLDLPEIEYIPTEKSTILASGKSKIKNKTQKDIKYDYIICVCGLAYFISSNIFNISTGILNILISGYTQRISRKTGNIEDEYVYSVIFDRENFQKINVKNIAPAESFELFKNRLDITKTGIMKTIIPFEGID